MKYLLMILGIVFSCTCCVPAAEKDPKAPDLPFIQRDVYPFEGCQYGVWKTSHELPVYDREGSTKKIAFTLKPGEEFTSIKGDMYIRKFGEIVILKDFEGFSKGNKVLLLSYKGEGFYSAWYKGEILEIACYGDNIKMICEPGMTWWVSVRNKENKEGWLKMEYTKDNGFEMTEYIHGMDAYE